VPVVGAGLPAIQSEFDWRLGTKPYTIPGSADPDVVGAFRFICGSAGLGRFDPMVYPGDKTGKSHLHNFYGNTGINPDSNYQSLRTSGKSTCGYGDYPLNRSAYWTAAMLDGKGNALEVDYAAVYYKRRPAYDPVVSALPGTPITPINPKDPPFAQGIAVPLPNGLRFIFGYDMLSGTPAPGVVDYVLQDPTNWAVFSNNGAGWSSIKAVAASGKARAGLQLIRRLHAPSCWDGKRVDSPNHRDHLSYPKYGSWGYPKCDAEHPFVIPEYQLQEVYLIAEGDDLAKWGASSDPMHPEAEDTSHADFFMAWDFNARDDWEANCLNKKLNCSAGNMGGGRAIDASQAKYPDASGNLVAANRNPNRSKPIPGPEANDRLIPN
jgi:hypothetical protein